MKLVIYIFIIASGCFSINRGKMHTSPAEDKISFKLVAKESFKVNDPVKVQFILENRSEKPLYFLKWHTPFEGINSDMFRIIRNGREIKYEGRMVKRGNPGREDYLVINPESSIDTLVELSLVYNMNETGEYRIEYRGILYDLIYAANQKEIDKMLPKSYEKLNMINITGNFLIIKVDNL